MDARPYVERCLEDEGVAAGLADPEATVLLDWLIDRVTASVEQAPDAASADAAARGWTKKARALARVAERLAYDADVPGAEEVWNEHFGPPPYPLASLEGAEAPAVVRKLIAWGGSDVA